jgi:hypothetical protein
MNNEAGTSCGVGKVGFVFLLMFPSVIHMASYKGFSLLERRGFSVLVCVLVMSSAIVSLTSFLMQAVKGVFSV